MRYWCLREWGISYSLLYITTEISTTIPHPLPFSLDSSSIEKRGRRPNVQALDILRDLGFQVYSRGLGFGGN